MMQGGDGGKTVPLKAGAVNEVKIDVTAEDGTKRVYCIHAKRLSAKDATLSGLKLGAAQLEPPFSPDVTDYMCNVTTYYGNS